MNAAPPAPGTERAPAVLAPPGCEVDLPPSRLSERSLTDTQAPMGYATTRPLDRVMAACGLLTQAELAFVPADDVPNGGVLCALPALLTEGLLAHTRRLYALPPGFYPLESIFLLLALLALARCRSLEQTRYQSPGEWGKILGLDRIPEVRTLREKLAHTCASSLARRRNGRAGWPPNGWPRRRTRTGWGCSTSTAMCAFTTAASGRCRGNMSPDKNCVCAGRPIFGSTGWAANRFSSSPSSSMPG